MVNKGLKLSLQALFLCQLMKLRAGAQRPAQYAYSILFRQEYLINFSGHNEIYFKTIFYIEFTIVFFVSCLCFFSLFWRKFRMQLEIYLCVQVKWSLPRHTNQSILPALINKIATHFLFQMHLAHSNHRQCSSANFENTLGATSNHRTNIYALQRKSHLCIPFLGIARPQPQFPHSCVCERFIQSQDRSTYFLQQNRQTDRGNI